MLHKYVLFCLVAAILSSCASMRNKEHWGFVDFATVSPEAIIEMRYNTDWNFIGRRIKGYKANRCYLTQAAARALAEVQKDLTRDGYTLLLLDCYRPQRAVNEFVEWTKDTSDQKMKSVFYPGENKEELVRRGYIDSRSGHSRGSVVDLTIVKLKDKRAPARLAYKENGEACRSPESFPGSGQVDMGTRYDCFSELSYTQAREISGLAHRNRLYLKTVMEKHGFENYEKEWWHFILKNEPYKDRFFDFEVE